MVSRVARAVWRHGPGGAVRLARDALFPNVRFLVLFGLTEPSGMPRPARQVEHCLATRDAAAGLPAPPLRADSLALLDRGDRCLIQTIGGRLAGIVWLSTAPVVEIHPGIRLTLPGDVVYTYRSWTAPEFRGLGLQGRRHLAVLESLGAEGRSRLLCYCAGANLASLRGVRKSGCRPIGRIRSSRIGRPQPALRITDPAWSEIRLARDSAPPEE